MNILILTSNTGGGHIKASEAICEQIKYMNIDYNVKSVNTLDHINHSFNKIITSFHHECIKTYPNLFGKIYYYSENDHLSINIFNSILKSLAKKFLPVILEFNTDIIISTHPFSTHMVSYLKDIGKIKNIKLINLITDYAPHKFWIQKNVDAYITATDQMTNDMIKRGVKKEIIYPIGIPVGTSFLKSHNKTEILNSINFDHDKFVILFMSGSVGVNLSIKIFKELLLNIDREFQIIIITGHNKCLYDKFNKIISSYEGNNIKFKLIEFTTEVSKYMSISDVIITKPGGLTTTEAIHSELPIIFFDAIPGQEEKNGEFILNNNIGLRISKSKEDVNKFIHIMDDKALLNEIKNNLRHIKKVNFINNLVAIIDSFSNKQKSKDMNYTC